MNKFELSLANDKIWNVDQLVKFLSHNVGKDIYLVVNPEAHDLEYCGLYKILDCFDFESVCIETNNCLEKHDRYTIVYRPVDIFLHYNFWKDHDLNGSGLWNQTKRFGVFYGRPTANRIGIASYLLSHYYDQSQVIFAKDIQDPDQRSQFELDKLFEYRAQSIVDFEYILRNNYFYTFDYTPFGHKYNPHNQLHQLYTNIFVDIISEPNIEGTTFYPTEKFSRCVLMKKPFITMCSSDYNEYLRQMGFQTFYTYWDESYDGFRGKNRFEKILSVIDSLSDLSTKQLAEMFEDMQPILQHNFDVLVKQCYNTKITEIK